AVVSETLRFMVTMRVRKTSRAPHEPHAKDTPLTPPARTKPLRRGEGPAQWLPKPTTEWMPQARKPLREIWSHSKGERENRPQTLEQAEVRASKRGIVFSENSHRTVYLSTGQRRRFTGQF